MVVATRRSLACLQALWSLGIGAFIAISVQRRTLFMFSCRCLFSSPMLRKQPNAALQARRTAGARYERTLFAVAWMPWLGAGVLGTPGLPTTAFGALTRLLAAPG